MNRLLVVVAIASLFSAVSAGQSPDELRREIESLRDESVAWRDIDWQTCLLTGLQRSSEQAKPVLLWVFIDRPTDDRRC